MNHLVPLYPWKRLTASLLLLRVRDNFLVSDLIISLKCPSKTTIHFLSFGKLCFQLATHLSSGFQARTSGQLLIDVRAPSALNGINRYYDMQCLQMKSAYTIVRVHGWTSICAVYVDVSATTKFCHRFSQLKSTILSI